MAAWFGCRGIYTSYFCTGESCNMSIRLCLRHAPSRVLPAYRYNTLNGNHQKDDTKCASESRQDWGVGVGGGALYPTVLLTSARMHRQPVISVCSEDSAGVSEGRVGPNCTDDQIQLGLKTDLRAPGLNTLHAPG